MRITNKMMTNTMLLNINKNQNMLNKYDMQVSSGKKIQRPSDDPVIAVRALRFRTTVSEIKQFQTNCEDAKSWCSVSEQAASNIIDILKRVRDLSVQASSDVLSVSNRKKIIQEMDQLSKQFLNEANSSYAGRYIFSGFKTSTPATFIEDNAENYDIQQTFGKSEIETIKKVLDTPAGERINEVRRLRLGYKDITLNGVNPALGLTVNDINSTDTDAYAPAAGTVNFLKDTGELIINQADESGLPAEFTVDYNKTGFRKGDLVPECYFNCTNNGNGFNYTNDKENMNYQISYSQMINVNSMADEIVPIDLQRDMEEIIAEVRGIKDDGSLEMELKADILSESFNKLLTKVDAHVDKLLVTRADIGSKINRLELTQNRLSEDELNFTDILSKNEDTDFAETLVKMSSMESVYRASLSATSKAIKSTLLDFIG